MPIQRLRRKLASAGVVVGLVAGTLALTSVSAYAALPRATVKGTTVTERDAAGLIAKAKVVLSRPAVGRTVVKYVTVAGTAKPGQDYTARRGKVVLRPGQRSKVIKVPITGDLLDENTEAFKVRIYSPTRARLGARRKAAVKILDNDPMPVASTEDASVPEGDTGVSTLHFPVSLSEPSGRTVTVPYSVSAGSAIPNTDFVAVPAGTLTFPAGTTSLPVDVSVIGDTLNEANETLTLTLGAPTNATLGTATGTGTIQDDDGPALSVPDLPVLEGLTATLPVTLANPSLQTVTVDYATVPGTATSPADFTSTTGTLTFLPGVTTQNVMVPTVNDTVDEVDETFTVVLSNPVNSKLGDPSSTVTILDDDGPLLSMVNVSHLEGWQPQNYVFTVLMSAPSPQQVDVDYATTNFNALAGSDYTATAGHLTFLPGQTSKTVTVPVAGDLVAEPNETFLLGLSNPLKATVPGSGLAVGTITNDDCYDLDEGAAGATDLGAMTGDATSSLSRTGTICLDDADWYHVRLTESVFNIFLAKPLLLTATLKPGLAPAQTAGNLVLEFWTTNGATLLGRSNVAGAGTETLSGQKNDVVVLTLLDPPDASDFLIKISGAPDNVNSYTLDLTGNLASVTPIGLP